MIAAHVQHEPGKLDEILRPAPEPAPALRGGGKMGAFGKAQLARLRGLKTPGANPDRV